MLWLEESLFTCLWTRVGDDLWGIDTTYPECWWALERGMNEWFLWQQLYNLNVWEGEETWRIKPQQGLLCNSICMCPWDHLSDPRGLLLNVFFRSYWNKKIYNFGFKKKKTCMSRTECCSHQPNTNYILVVPLHQSLWMTTRNVFKVLFDSKNIWDNSSTELCIDSSVSSYFFFPILLF